MGSHTLGYRLVVAGSMLCLCLGAGCRHRGRVVVRPHPVVVKKGPPVWAPAHGRRVMCHYYYYPGACVYFDIEREVYFYRVGAEWRTAATLPAHMYLDGGSRVTLDLETPRPYEVHARVVKRHPPKRVVVKSPAAPAVVVKKPGGAVVVKKPPPGRVKKVLTTRGIKGKGKRR